MTNNIDLTLFEQRLMFYVLRAIGDHPMSTKTDIMRLDKGFEKTKFDRIGQLIDRGYVGLVREENYSTQRLKLTRKGEYLYERMKEIEGVDFDGIEN